MNDLDNSQVLSPSLLSSQPTLGNAGEQQQMHIPTDGNYICPTPFPEGKAFPGIWDFKYPLPPRLETVGVGPCVLARSPLAAGRRPAGFVA